MATQLADAQVHSDPVSVEQDDRYTLAVKTLLSLIGEDPSREGLQRTPRRVVNALREMTQGYWEHPDRILATTFSAEGYNEMVVLRGIEFVSLCEHHILPFTGTATLAYVPETRIVGLSKLARLVGTFSRRLQVQERMTVEIADALEQHLHPQGVGVVIRASHHCMGCRGARQPNAIMVTSVLRGCFMDNPAARAELFSL